MSLTKLIYIVVIFLIVGLGIVLFLVQKMEESEQTNQTNTSSLSSFTNQIALTCQNELNWGIYLFDENNQELKNFLDSSQDELMPVINHNANKLYYILKEDIYNRLVEYSLTNNQKKNLIFTKNDILSLKISQNGQKLIYLENPDNSLYYYNLETDQSKEVANQVTAYAWFSDNYKFVYVKEGNMYLGNINRLTDELEKDQLVVSGVASPVAVPGLIDTFLAVSPTATGLNLVLVDTKQRSLKDFSKIEFSASDMSTFRLSYSPDQANILLVITEADDDLKTKVWTINRTGQTVTGILSDIGQPIWSSDGQSIYYIKKEESGTVNIWSYNLSNKEAKQLTFLTKCVSPNTVYTGENINRL